MVDLKPEKKEEDWVLVRRRRKLITNKQKNKQKIKQQQTKAKKTHESLKDANERRGVDARSRVERRNVKKLVSASLTVGHGYETVTHTFEDTCIFATNVFCYVQFQHNEIHN